MNTLAKLRAKLANLNSQGTAKVAEFNTLSARLATLTGNAQAELQAQADALEGEIDQLAEDAAGVKAEIATEEKRAKRNAMFGTTAITPPGAVPAGATEPGAVGNGGFRSMAEFATAVRSAAWGNATDPRLLAMNAAIPAGTFHNGGTAGEGFLVPTDFRDQIWEIVMAQGDLLARTDSSPTQSNSVSNLKDETTPWGASGIIVAWRAEAARMDASKFATKGMTTTLHEMYAFTLATDELLEDAPLLATRLTQKAGQAIAWKASESIVTGDGVGKPLGFLRSKALVVVDPEANQAAQTINVDNVSKMYSRFLPSALGGATWLANSEILPQLMKLTVGSQPIWTPPQAGFANAPGGFLLGLPVEWSEHAEPLGSVGDLMLTQLKGYASFTKASGINFASSIHLYFDMGMQAFRWTFRVGGQPYLSKPVAPAKGTATKSHFVALGAR